MNAHANPEGGVVSAGQATISASGKNLNIHQQTNKAVIDWRGFDIGADETTNFYQPGKNSVTLNRVHSNSASQINGKLNANGNVVIVNQNGVVFGAGAQVDVHGLVASTADIDNDRFMNDAKLHFDKAGKADARIINNGSISARDAGLVGFVAPNVENNGIISAKMGRVHLASGSKATVDFYGDGLMEVEVDDNIHEQLVANTGAIDADGGTIALTAAAGGQIVHGLINASGVLRAQSVGVKNGEIVISAAGSNKTQKQGRSNVIVSGSLDVSGQKAGETGGKITVTGDHITLENTARLKASGHAGGGSIKLGGDYQGKGPTQTAATLTVNKDAIIENDATETGNGGSTILWSDVVTSFAGNIYARGGRSNGDGGFAEVSGKQGLTYNGFADLTAVNGDLGELLLDPTDITISNAASSSISYAGGVYSGTAASSNLNVSVLQTQLASANVTVTTASGQVGGGDITILDPITWTSARTLTLTADRDIFINAAITASGAGNAGVNATGRDIIFNANVSAFGTGGVNATASRNLTVASGATVSSGATGLMSLRAAGGVISGTGLLTLDGRIRAGTGSFTLVSGLNGAARSDITLNASKFAMLGASVGNASITGFNDITLDTALSSSGTTTLTAQRDLTMNGTFTGTGATSALTATALRDLYFNGVASANGAGGITGLATNNLTVAATSTLSSGATGVMSLRAAGGTIGNQGLLTINGQIRPGSNAVALTSGLNGADRNDLIINTTHYNPLAASSAGITITGFRDVTVDQDVVSSGAMTIVAGRHLTINPGTTARAGTSLILQAASGNIANTGLFNMNGRVYAGTNSLTLTSGVDGANRSNLILDGSTYAQAATVGTITITGFNDIDIDTPITVAATV